MCTPSPTSSISSGHVSTVSTISGPQQNEYIRSHKNISFSFVEGSNSFQQGQLGDNDTFLVGTLHLSYPKSCQVKSVHLHFKGIEKTSWYKSQARSKYVYAGEHTLVDQTNKIWEAYNDVDEITNLDIPFKIQLPYNLPETVTTDIGSVQYILRATVNTKSLIGTTQQSVKINCPLMRTVMLDTLSIPPYKLSGETPSGIEYNFILPPNKSFKLGTYVSIPMKLRFKRPNVGIEKLELNLRTSMDFQSTTLGESKHVDQQIMGMIITRSDLFYSQPGECTYTVNLFVPRKVQPTYQGRFIGIAHFLSVKFCLWGFEVDFQVEESVRIANIMEKHAKSSNSQAPRSPQTPPPLPLPPKHAQITPPILTQQYPYANNDGSIESSYYQLHFQAPPPLNVNNKKSTQEHPEDFYDRPFDGYNSPQQILGYASPNFFNSNMYCNKSESSGSQRNSSGTSTPSRDSETNLTMGGAIGDFMNMTVYPTNLSPPPYRQVTRQMSQISQKSQKSQTSQMSNIVNNDNNSNQNNNVQ